MRILLVEDLQSDVELIRLELLAEWPALQLDCAGTRQAVHDALLQPPPDVVLCDSRLPGIHGAEILDLVAAAWPGTPLVFCVGAAQDDPLLESALPRAAGLVDKNRLQALVPTIRRVLSAQRRA